MRSAGPLPAANFTPEVIGMLGWLLFIAIYPITRIARTIGARHA